MSFDYSQYGKKAAHFRQARRLALAASQAAGALWEFRWDPATTGAVCLVNRVTLKAIQIAAATPEELRFNLKVGRTFTASDDTNTASILRSASDMQKLNGDYADTLLAGFRESNSATAATGGTKTLDTDSIAQGSLLSLAAVQTTPSLTALTVFDYAPLANGEQPLRLESDEGWVISLEVAKGATTGIVLLMETEWTEVLANAGV